MLGGLPLHGISEDQSRVYYGFSGERYVSVSIPIIFLLRIELWTHSLSLAERIDKGVPFPFHVTAKGLMAHVPDLSR